MLSKNKKNKKGFSGIQVLFFIMMSIAMVGLIIFGITRIASFNEQLSEKDRIAFKNDFKEVADFCEDPLNRGSFKTFRIRHSTINKVCILGEDLGEMSGNEDAEAVYDAGDNVVFLKEANNDVQIVDSFLVDTRLEVTKCWDNYDGGDIEVQIDCQ